MIATDLDPARIAGLLETRRYGRSIDVRERTGSTNDEAHAARDVPDGHVVLADMQTAGRGSQGRSWDSPPGSDLYFSIVARVGALAPASVPPLTLAVGLGVARTCEALVDAEVTLKWPNDVRLDGRKCAGILVESVSVGARIERVVIGVGVDVNREAWPEELGDIATSLRMVSGERLDRAVVLGRLLAHIEDEVDRFLERGPAAIVPGVEARLAWKGREVSCGDHEGTLLGLRADGALRLATREGERCVLSGTLREL